MASHIEKLACTADVSERHLFLVQTDEALPALFFTNDFEVPASAPAGFDSLDALWVWSRHWQRYLAFRDGLGMGRLSARDEVLVGIQSQPS